MRNHFRLLGLLTSLVLTACGGGGGGSSAPAGTAEGIWSGTLSNGRDASGVVLADGSVWFLYNRVNDPNPTFIAGLVQGLSTSTNGDFTVSNARDFNFEGQFPEVTDGTISGNYAQKTTLDGSVTAPGGSLTFNFAYDNSYDQTPNLALIAGTYIGGDVSTTESVNVTIETSGLLTFVSQSGCSGTGLVTPNPNGNVYDIAVTFSGGVCSNGTSTVTGVLAAEGVDIVAAALNPTRTNGFVYRGRKI